MKRFSAFIKSWGLALAIVGAVPVAAQELESIDPDAAYGPAEQGDLAPLPDYVSPVPQEQQTTATQAAPSDEVVYSSEPLPGTPAPTWADPEPAEAPAMTDEELAAAETTYGEDDLIGAAEGVFGDGAKGIAKMIEKMLAEQGRPNGYIVGREAGGAFVVGARYGSGTLYHKVEGERPVYWTGPSIGFDAGANAGKTFVLVYNLFDTEELYERYPAGEGQAYVVGGMHASYLRKGDVVLIPIRMGAGLRLGVNAGYMKFSKKQRWLPF
ncbi:DUF1134 domain-containing protein [Altererythrobacter lutimaris]|uniref:DUF1134 domain-containing protein n=1 Tax=Altererythrobacter lutimaris TaxID=2743979 RepID=A0A850HD51_9SPHN|nr:DUF1134 domain-containing protein [Altererythrobacter lutimaris]NVE94916.1 DUF1134 domain-containing protein [Altererythrobacter lutimaris]